MPKVTVTDLFAKIGQLTVENEALRSENEMLLNELRKEVDNVPSEVPSTVPGPNDDAGLE